MVAELKWTKATRMVVAMSRSFISDLILKERTVCDGSPDFYEKHAASDFLQHVLKPSLQVCRCEPHARWVDHLLQTDVCLTAGVIKTLHKTRQTAQARLPVARVRTKVLIALCAFGLDESRNCTSQ